MASRLWQKKVALPPEKGGWVWWIGPLVLGAAAARGLHPDLLAVVVAGFAGFSLRQPVNLILRARARGRTPEELSAARVWAALYALALGLAGLWLVLRGHRWALAMAAAGAPVLGWSFRLVWQGDERHQHRLQALAAALLSLTGPAAYWSCGGRDNRTALLVWLLPVLQSVASIVHVVLRLAQRRLDRVPPAAERWRAGLPALAWHTAGLAAALAAWAAGWAHPLVPAAFLLPLAEGIHAVEHPPLGHSARRLGFQQLALDIAFLAVAAAGFRLGP
jgi:hypothetical protein